MIPSHAAIDILEPVALCVTMKLVLLAELLSAAAVLGNGTYEVHDAFAATFGASVERIGLGIRRSEGANGGSH